MTGPEELPEALLGHSYEAVNVLKYALLSVGEQLEWQSSDGEYSYVAQPAGSEVDYATLSDMPGWKFAEKFNLWSLLRRSNPDINGDVTVDHFGIIPHMDMPLFVQHYELPLSILLHDVDEVTDDNRDELVGKLRSMIEAEGEIQKVLHREDATIEDHAILDNALFDLEAFAQAAFKARMEARRNMTQDEKRWERMQKYQWLITPELDKKAEPRWWGFSEGGSVHAVYASSPDLAAAILEEHHLEKYGTTLFPLFFVDPYTDEVQTDMAKKFEGREVMRLIPHSIVEWPSDPKNMTDEQKAAFDRLRPKD